MEKLLIKLRETLFNLALLFEPQERILLIEAVIKVESNGNDYAIGDLNLKNKAFGPMQIRKPCVDDVNLTFGTNYKAEDCLGNRPLSKWIFCRYADIYPKPEWIQMSNQEYIARNWNGGPFGYKKKSTEIYWSKIKKHLK